MNKENKTLDKQQNGNDFIADVSISKNQLLERLNMEFHFKYLQYPEGETQEDYPKRCLKGEGFLNAMKVVADFY